MMKKNASRPSANHGRCSPPGPTPPASGNRVRGGAFDAAVVAHSGGHSPTRSGRLEHPLPSPRTSPQLHVPGGGAGGTGLPTAVGHAQRTEVLRGADHCRHGARRATPAPAASVRTIGRILQRPGVL
jgi:hypothetical protein